MNRIKLTNNDDLGAVRRGLLSPDAVRSMELDALVDTGAVALALPEDVVQSLGLTITGAQNARDALGRTVTLQIASSVRFEMLGRGMTCDAFVLPVGATPLIGQIQLEMLDLVVDPRAQEARVNPASPDFPIVDFMACA